jgi:hypothetical protein
MASGGRGEAPCPLLGRELEQLSEFFVSMAAQPDYFGARTVGSRQRGRQRSKLV